MAMAGAGAVRAFNRFYSEALGATSRRYLGSPFSLPEARLIFEVAGNPGITAREVRARVAFSQGHLSRMVARLQASGLLRLEADPRDRRRRRLRLTAQGRAAYRRLDAAATAQAASLLQSVPPSTRGPVLAALGLVRAALGDPALPPPRIRKGRAGDLGWAFQRQAALYHEEFGYSRVFERYVAAGLPPFLDAFDPRRDALWVAERAGAPLGCIAVQHDPERAGWAKLRWFFVEAPGRGQGIGSALLRTALSFCRRAGYAGVLLWTVDDLHAARRQYERAGFALAFQAQEPCPWAPWGHEQRWELPLRRSRGAEPRPHRARRP